MIFLDIEQRSDEWLRWRNAGIGSSDVAAIIGLSPWQTPEELLAEKRAHHRAEQLRRKRKESGAMARGRRLEPQVLLKYESLMGWGTVSVCGVHEQHDFLKASFDGLTSADPVLRTMMHNRDYKVARDYLIDNPRARLLPVEVKCPNHDAHQLALDGEVPDYYLPQCHHLMLVAEARQLHYVSFSDYFPKARQIAVVTVELGTTEREALLEACQEFWLQVISA